MSQHLGDRIAARAYELFLARGGQHGHHLDDWLAAEAELTQRTYDVVLADPGRRTIEVVRAIRELTELGLAEIQPLIEAAPQLLQRVRSLAAAERFRSALEPLGARVDFVAVE
jgi:ribosomal protein L7/L12